MDIFRIIGIVVVILWLSTFIGAMAYGEWKHRQWERRRILHRTGYLRAVGDLSTGLSIPLERGMGFRFACDIHESVRMRMTKDVAEAMAMARHHARAVRGYGMPDHDPEPHNQHVWLMGSHQIH